MPRYLIVRSFNVGESDMPAVGRRSRKVIEDQYPQIVWEHSHVVVGDDGLVKTYCVYEGPSEEVIRSHSEDLGEHTIDAILEIAGDVTPADFPG